VIVLPNFIIFGALKGGTTSLYQYLKQHPQVYMSPLKEARFFAYDESDPELRNKPEKLFPIKTLDEYERLFAGVRDEKAVGEASPGYLESPIAAARIKECIPDAKLVVSLRNPIDRIYSLYQMAYRSGSETRSPSEALADTGYWLERFGYYLPLKRYFDLFDNEQIKVILFEDLKRNTIPVIQELYRFLAVDDKYIPDISVVHNPGGIPKNSALYKLTKNRVLRQLGSVLPKGAKSWVSSMKNKSLQKAPPLDPEIRTELAIRFRDNTLRLQDLIQQDLSAWLIR
jgi:hypothetical protein